MLALPQTGVGAIDEARQRANEEEFHRGVARIVVFLRETVQSTPALVAEASSKCEVCTEKVESARHHELQTHDGPNQRTAVEGHSPWT